MLLNCGAGEDAWSPLDCREIQPVYPKENQSWIFIWRNDAETEAPILWPADAKNWLIWKDPDLGKDWRPEEKGMTEKEMVGWHHRLDGHVFESFLGVGDGQGGLLCCRPWGCKVLDTTEQLIWSDLIIPTSLLYLSLVLCLLSFLQLCFKSFRMPSNFLLNSGHSGLNKRNWGKYAFSVRFFICCRS